jgi:hypothetical protein
MSVRVSTLIAALALFVVPGTSSAQVRGFGDVGFVRFTASDSFDAVVDSPGGVIFGGGVEVDLPRHLFVALRASQFRKDGHRVFVFDDTVFPLNTEATITVRPIELSVGYRFDHGGSPLVPYVGGGIGWHRYKETSAAAASGEDVSGTFTGYQVMGGVTYRLGRLFGVAGEGSWSSVPNTLGDDPNSVAAAFDESDLGGFTARVKFVVGR